MIYLIIISTSTGFCCSQFFQSRNGKIFNIRQHYDFYAEGLLFNDYPFSHWFYPMQIDEFFTEFEDSRPLFDALSALACRDACVSMRVGKSQVAFWDRKPFLWAWIPGRYLKNRPTAPLVMTVVFRQWDPSPRWKEIMEARNGWFTHHLELYDISDIDDEVANWIARAYAARCTP